MTVTGIITALIVGLIIGALGRLVVPGRQNIPIWLTMVIGVVAALIGTAIANAIGVSTDTPWCGLGRAARAGHRRRCRRGDHRGGHGPRPSQRPLTVTVATAHPHHLI
ncbi:hypothetical protein GCM10020218_096580 [Dactylosporangium vinaceum]